MEKHICFEGANDEDVVVGIECERDEDDDRKHIPMIRKPARS